MASGSLPRPAGTTYICCRKPHWSLPLTPSLSPIAEAAARRRTFAIISHPDAGKTTLTEKLLLFGGAIHLAGEVRAKGERRRARSDWMKIEQQRGHLGHRPR